MKVRERGPCLLVLMVSCLIPLISSEDFFSGHPTNLHFEDLGPEVHIDADDNGVHVDTHAATLSVSAHQDGVHSVRHHEHFSHHLHHVPEDRHSIFRHRPRLVTHDLDGYSPYDDGGFARAVSGIGHFHGPGFTPHFHHFPHLGFHKRPENNEDGDIVDSSIGGHAVDPLTDYAYPEFKSYTAAREHFRRRHFDPSVARRHPLEHGFRHEPRRHLHTSEFIRPKEWHSENDNDDDFQPDVDEDKSSFSHGGSSDGEPLAPRHDYTPRRHSRTSRFFPSHRWEGSNANEFSHHTHEDEKRSPFQHTTRQPTFMFPKMAFSGLTPMSLVYRSEIRPGGWTRAKTSSSYIPLEM